MNQYAIAVHFKQVFFYTYSESLSHSSSISFLFTHYSFQLHIYIYILKMLMKYFPHSNILLYVIGFAWWLHSSAGYSSTYPHDSTIQVFNNHWRHHTTNIPFLHEGHFVYYQFFFTPSLTCLLPYSFEPSLHAFLPLSLSMPLSFLYTPSLSLPLSMIIH